MNRRSLLTRLLATLLACAMLFSSSVVMADTEKARQYYKQAVELYNNGEFEKAAQLLKKAYEEEPNLTYQYNRIRALEGAGMYREALEVLKTYEQTMLDAKGFEDIPKLKDQLERKVGETTPDKDTAPPDEKPDDQMEPPGDPGQDEETGPSTRQIITVGVLGGGGLILGTGVLFSTGVLLPSDVATAADEAEIVDGQRNFTGPNAEHNASVYNLHRNTGLILLGVGSAAVITGGVLLLTGGGESNQSAALTPGGTTDDGKPRVRVAPIFGAQGGGAQLNIKF